jgi:hypothetical protein
MTGFVPVWAMRTVMPAAAVPAIYSTCCVLLAVHLCHCCATGCSTGPEHAQALLYDAATVEQGLHMACAGLPWLLSLSLPSTSPSAYAITCCTYYAEQNSCWHDLLLTKDGPALPPAGSSSTSPADALAMRPSSE